MKLREEQIEFRGERFTVKELTVKQMMPLIASVRPPDEAAEGQGVDDLDANTQSELAYGIFEAACFHNGQPMLVDETPAGVYMKLIPVAMKLNGLGADQKGNA